MTKKALENKKKIRAKRKLKIRLKCIGSAETPRLSVFRSNKYFYAQVIDDEKGITLFSINGKKLGLNNNKENVTKIAIEFAKTLSSNNIKNVVFDRNGYLYHGVIASFADGLRTNGIVF